MCQKDLELRHLTNTQGFSISPPRVPSGALMEFTMLQEWLVFDPAAPQKPLGLVTTGGLAAVLGL